MLKQISRSGFSWIVLFYILGVSILLGLIGLLFLLSPVIDFLYYCAILISLGIGILHTFLLFRYILIDKKLARGFLITLFIITIGLTISFLTSKFSVLNLQLLSYVFFFPVPLLSWITYKNFLQIPKYSYKLWFYPLNEEMPDLDMIDLSDIIVIQFIFHKKAEDASPTNFTAKAPLNMSLGQLFFIFINDYNYRNEQNAIEYLNKKDESYGWSFLIKRKWWLKSIYLDPDVSVGKNEVQPNDKVYVRRVTVT